MFRGYIDAITYPLQRTAMHYAARKGHAAAIKFLHERGSRALDLPDANGFTPMHHAAMNNSFDAVKQLIALGSKGLLILDYKSRDPVNYSTYNWQVEILEYFCRLDSRFVDSRFTEHGSPLHNTAQTNSLSSALVLHRYGTEMHFVLNSDGDYPAKEKRLSFGFGLQVRQLYFSRTLFEILFFALEKKTNFYRV